MEPDFSGWATKANLQCSDGRTIMPDAFKHMDGQKVPLLYAHGHKDPENVLGHVILHAKPEGVWVDAFFNKTKKAQVAKELVIHRDIDFMSIFANQLVEKSKQVFHGIIREVSLVLAGANPGAKIQNVKLIHGDDPDDFEILPEDAVIYTGLSLVHEDAPEGDSENTIEHESLLEIIESMTEKQRDVLDYMVEVAAAGNVEHSDDAASEDEEEVEEESSDDDTEDGSEDGSADNAEDGDDEGEDSLDHQEGNDMTRNTFEQNKAGAVTSTGGELKHHELLTGDAMKATMSEIAHSVPTHGTFKKAAEAFALAHGITNLEILFPDAKAVDQTPEWDKRKTEWVPGVLNGVRHLPFARIKSRSANIKMEEARALGYIKGNFKKEEWFSVTQRETTPTTVYKKQKLDRDDIIDITDFNVVIWMKGEMRMMLEEELARAIMLGDGRPVEDPANPGEPNPDKIKDPAGAASGPGIRSILNDHELYVTTINVNVDDANSSQQEVVDEILLGREFHKGTGTPTFYTTERQLVKMLLTKDSLGRRLWRNKAELASELMVDNIVTMEVMYEYPDLVGILVNLVDYATGTDKGGEVTLFDDFDIDYNQEKYLIETRLSGALTKLKAATVVKKVAAAAVLVAPDFDNIDFDPATGALSVTDQANVVFKHDATTLNALGSPYTVPAGTTWTVQATPAAGYYFATSENDSQDYTADA